MSDFGFTQRALLTDALGLPEHATDGEIVECAKLLGSMREHETDGPRRGECPVSKGVRTILDLPHDGRVQPVLLAVQNLYGMDVSLKETLELPEDATADQVVDRAIEAQGAQQLLRDLADLLFVNISTGASLSMFRDLSVPTETWVAYLRVVGRATKQGVAGDPLSALGDLVQVATMTPAARGQSS